VADACEHAEHTAKPEIGGAIQLRLFRPCVLVTPNWRRRFEPAALVAPKQPLEALSRTSFYLTAACDQRSDSFRIRLSASSMFSSELA